MRSQSIFLRFLGTSETSFLDVCYIGGGHQVKSQHKSLKTGNRRPAHDDDNANADDEAVDHFDRKSSPLVSDRVTG